MRLMSTGVITTMIKFHIQCEDTEMAVPRARASWFSGRGSATQPQAFANNLGKRAASAEIYSHMAQPRRNGGLVRPAFLQRGIGRSFSARTR
jgi:hypothetical protein